MPRWFNPLLALVVPLVIGCASAPEEERPAEGPRIRPALDNQPAVQPSNRDLADLALAAMKLQAKIDKQIAEYQKRPRKRYVGQNADEYRFAEYEEAWRQKVERIGRDNYPQEIRGGPPHNLRLTVTIRSDGSVQSVELDRSSGSEAVDRTALRIIELASPFASFPPQIAKDTDLLVITRTWFFGGPADQAE